MTAIPRITHGPARTTAMALPASEDHVAKDRLASVAPDVPVAAPRISWTGAVGRGATLGAAAGLLVLRPSGWELTSLGTGAWKGAAIGVGVAAVLAGVDHLTGGAVKRQLDLVSLDRRHQILFVLKHPLRPWLTGMGLGVADAANAVQRRYFGAHDPMDGAPDALRHGYAAALFTLRAMRDHGESSGDAASLAIEAGDAHEADGQDNNDSYSHEMDAYNNRVGARLAGDGKPRAGEAADDAGWITERALADRVLDAIGAGEIQVVDRDATGAHPRLTTSADLSELQPG